MIKVQSFSYRDNGEPTSKKDDLIVFDCRELRNPYHHGPLCKASGLDKDVRQYIMDDATSRERATFMISHALGLSALDDPRPFTIAFGCTGGQHRSVAMATMFGQTLKTLFIPHTVEHLNL